MKTTPRITLVLLFCTLLLAAFGSVKYHDAPITHNELGYFDKRFNSYSEVEYRYFKIWEGSLLIAGIATALGAVGCLVAWR
jgi:hypothetical protein